MQFTESLKKNFQFRHVYQKGKSIANRHLVLYMVKNGTHDHNRLGISVSKKVGKVCRSLRHLFKKQQLLLSASERKDRQEKSEAGRKEEKEEGTQ